MVQAPPKINISSLLEKRPFQSVTNSEIHPIKVDPVRPFTSVDKTNALTGINFASSSFFDFKVNKRDTKEAAKIEAASLRSNVTSNFNLAHRT